MTENGMNSNQQHNFMVEKKKNQLRFLKFYVMIKNTVIVHTPLSREVFWHEHAKIPRHTARIA